MRRKSCFGLNKSYGFAEQLNGKVQSKKNGSGVHFELEFE